MVGRLSALHIADRRDVVLVTILGIASLAFNLVWAFFLVEVTGPIGPYVGLAENDFNKYFITFVLLAFAVIAAFIPRISWGRADRKPRASLMVRFGLSLMIFSLLLTLVGVYFATDPTRSVPAGFSAFTGMLLGTFVAGFGGNMLAPPRA